jgi:hypothetical protein
MRARLVLALTLCLAAFAMLGSASASQAAVGSLRILVDGNSLDNVPDLAPAIRAKPGVAVVDSFNSFDGTPAAADLASYDLVVDTGDADYANPALYGDRLADYIDQGGALVQFAYDNWEEVGAFPSGRFESGGYAPFIPGDNQNDPVTLGDILVPGSPLLAGVTSIASDLNTTDDLAPGATLLAKWSDDRNAIATKGRVVSTTAAPQTGDFDPLSAAGQLVVNAGNQFAKQPPPSAPSGPTGQQAAALRKCKKHFKKNHKKKKFKKCKKKARKLPV